METKPSPAEARCATPVAPASPVPPPSGSAGSKQKEEVEEERSATPVTTPILSDCEAKMARKWKERKEKGAKRGGQAGTNFLLTIYFNRLTTRLL